MFSEESSSHSQMRRLAQQVMMDSSIPESEKSRRIQELLYSRNNDIGKPADHSNANTIAVLETPRVSYHDPSRGVFGCKHYSRGSLLKAPCCGKWVPCRFCHDSNSDHEMNRFAVKTMWCMSCGVAQPIQRQCQNCRVIVAEYYCSICKLLDNDPRKEIYHCNDCGLCRCGPRHKYFHCKKCNTCMEKIRKNNHRCFERILDRNCPICSEYLFTSTEKASFMKCGHAIHESCLRKLAEYSYQCPICNKSLGDMSSYFERIDQLVASQTMPKEYAGRISEIFCNDCEQRSKAPFNFIYHKCGHCGSYSTTLIGSYGGNHVAASSPPISPAPPMGNHGYQSITQHHPQAITPEVPLSPSIPNQTDRNEMYQSNHTREPRSPNTNSGI